MATLQFTFTDLYNRISEYLKDSYAPTGADLTEVKRIANDGYLRFLNERDWSFLYPESTLVVWPTGTATGTTISTTTLTVSAAFFYPSMIGHTIAFTLTGNTFTIASVTSTTVAVMTASMAAETQTDTVTITANGRYRLPSDFGGLTEGFAYDNDNPYTPPRRLSPQAIVHQQSLDGGSSGPPSAYALQAESFTITDGQRWEIVTHPISDSTYTWYYRYRINPAAMATETTEIPLGGPKHAFTILQSCLALAEMRRGDTNGPQQQRYKITDGRGNVVGGELKNSFDRDNEDRPSNLGYNGDRSDGYEMTPQRIAVIRTYSSS